jgi:hypothetical protein
MRKFISYIPVFIFLTAACILPFPFLAKTSPIENTSVPVATLLNTILPTETPQYTISPTNTAQITSSPSESAQNTVAPTFTPTAKIEPTVQDIGGFRTFTPAPEVPGPPNEIKFAANGTYTDLTDTIEFGLSKTYSLNAMKGQIMSISILPLIPDGGWGYIPIQIKGADGNILCPQSADSECLFWRGVLPASQDYFIRLTPNGDVPKFVLRVAIDPPGKDVQYFQYANQVTGISLTYPDTFVPAVPVVGNYKSQPQLALHFIDSKYYDNTNLGEVYLFFSSTTDSQIVATCTSANQNGGGPEQILGNETIHGYTFVHSTSTGAGAGNYYEQEVYRMVKKKACYEVIYYIHYTNIGNYTPGTVTEYDSAALMQELLSVFSTFTIK